ncbi:PAS domain-containing protein [bacterium]|nr:PAS domain-containing protein [bacterium]
MSYLISCTTSIVLFCAISFITLFGTNHHQHVDHYLISILCGLLTGIIVSKLRSSWIIKNTDLKQLIEVLEKLKYKEAHLQAILDNTSLAIYLKDVEFRYIMVNRKYEELANVKGEDIYGKTDFDIFPENVAKLFREQDGKVIKLRASENFEETIPLPDGIHSFITSKFPIFDEEGSLKFVGGVCTEITIRKAMEKKLHTEQNRLEVTLNSINETVISTDMNGVITFTNKIASELVGIKYKKTIGFNIFDIIQLFNFDGENKKNIFTDYFNLEEKKHISGEALFQSKSENIRNVYYSFSPISSEEGNSDGIVIVIRDVTEELRLRDELFNTKKLESIGLLAGGIAHDFNNILVAIICNLNLAEQFAKDNKNILELLKDAESATFRASELTNQLLTFSKGNFPQRKVLSIDKLIRESTDFALRGSNVSCDYNFEDFLKMVDVDPGQMSQVFQNLIINAVHAMPEGGTINILGKNVENGYVRIEIEDHGIGISENLLDKIFDPYFSTKKKGSGLGLAICHSIMSKHGGSISVNSSVGKGTSFIVDIPVSLRSVNEDTLPSEIIHKGEGLILIMDDEKSIHDSAGKILNHLGYEVMHAYDGDEAISQYKQMFSQGKPIHTVLMDLTVPGGKNGKIAVSEILDIDSTARVIVMSGYSKDPIIANYSDYGFVSSLSKPFGMKELSKVVNDLNVKITT